MTDRQEIELVLGIPGDEKRVKLELPPDEPRPWDKNSSFKIVGHRYRRQEGVAKVTGAARFGWDINLPGMLIGGFVRSPWARARVKSVDLRQALSLKGVQGGFEVHRNGNIMFAGAPVAVLAAENRRILEQALQLVHVDYEVKPHAARMDMAIEEGAPRVSTRRPNVRPPRKRRRSPDLEKAFQEARKVVEATCTTQVQTHSCLETHGAVARFSGDELTLWASTQATFGSQRQMANLFGIPTSKVTVICHHVGGGFGSKFSAGYMGAAAARLAKETGRPVKIFLDRRGEHTDVGNRPSSWQKMKLGVSADGRLGPYQVEVTGTSGINRGRGARNPMIYAFDRRLVDRRAGDVLTNAGPSTAFRAPGHPEGAFAMECILDLAAEALKMDPLAFRLRNNTNPVRAMQFTEGARLIGWDSRLPNGQAQGRYRRGLGVASSTWPIQGGPTAEALCVLHRDGAVEIRSGAQDLGTGTRTLIALVVAEELGLAPEAVAAFIGNTNDPPGPASGGSVTGASLAPAARQGAYLAGRELRDLAARHLGCRGDELIFEGGQLRHVKNPKQRLSWKEACRLMPEAGLRALGRRKRNWRNARYHSDVAGCQFAEVEVDTWFGNIRVKRIVALHDAGIVVNRAAAESQVLGGVIQGISYALFEERILDRHEGRILNADLETYKIVGSLDMPDIQVVLHDVANGASNASVCALGEPPTIPTSGAIAGAVHNALGVRLKHLPMTPDKVLEALG